jgi:hypothetical protein
MLEVVGATLEWLCEVPTYAVEAWTQEGEQLAGVVVMHLVARYRSINLAFSLAPVHASASEEA